jgi:CRISPR-associated protein Csm1
MEALLERVSLDANGKMRPTRYRLSLVPLSLAAVRLFPKSVAEFTPPMVQEKTQHGDTWLNPTPLNAEYASLADQFLVALSKMPIYDSETPAAKRGVVTTLLTQMERFLHCVPAATNIVHPDISLFDHLRVTAAIAEGLYLHHEAKGTLDRPETFTDLDTAKWRLVCGDFSGIQDFIYNIVSAGAARRVACAGVRSTFNCCAMECRNICCAGLVCTQPHEFIPLAASSICCCPIALKVGCVMKSMR